MWFDTWAETARVAIVGVAAYAALVVMIRVSGKRTLAQLNAFDLVVTVALGSTLATILLSGDVSYVEGVLALAVLVILQIIVAFVVSRVRRAKRFVTSAPALLVDDGRVDEKAARRHRVARSDILQAVRQSGHGSLGDVAAVVLESNGSLSVISQGAVGDASAMQDLD